MSRMFPFFGECLPRGAEKEFKKALKLNSNCSTAHQWYANLLTVVGRNQEAVVEANRARDLDPLSIPANAFLGFVYMRARQDDLALQASGGAVDLDHNNPFGHWLLARVFDVRNELSKALAEAQKAVELSGSGLNFVAHLGYALARAGNRRRAGEIARKLIRTSASRYVSPYLVAIIYTGMKQTDSAFEWLEKAYSDRAARLTELCDPPFDELRADPRFQRLMHRVGLPVDSVALDDHASRFKNCKITRC